MLDLLEFSKVKHGARHTSAAPGMKRECLLWLRGALRPRGGGNSVARGKLALQIVQGRFELCGFNPNELRFDLIGVNALHGSSLSQRSEPYEVRVRVAARCDTREQAVKVGNEVETLYTNGPAGGGGVMKSVKEILAMDSTLIPRNKVEAVVTVMES